MKVILKFHEISIMHYNHLESRVGVLAGKPCIKGTRISVQIILEWFAGGATKEEILQAYPQISGEAFQEAMLFAADQMRNDLYFDFPKAT
jgi:uncharacterized protein (DUF433 family)